jgi:hypothetical protein
MCSQNVHNLIVPFLPYLSPFLPVTVFFDN